jgi:hypothetical protein
MTSLFLVGCIVNDPENQSAFEILNYNQQLVQFADSKAGNLIVINSLFIAAAQTSSTSSLLLKLFQLSLVAASGMALLLCLSVIMSRTQLPRLPRKDCIFFADVAQRKTMGQYLRDFAQTDPQDLLDDTLRRTYVLAIIARRKFDTYAWAQRATAGAALMWLLLSGLQVLFG